MRKMYGPLAGLLVIFIGLSAAFSCRKSISNMRTSGGGADSLMAETQSVYTIDSTGTPTPGIILTAPFASVPPTTPNQGLLLMMDQRGKVLQQQTTAGTAFNFNRWVINGQTRYTYLENDPAAYRINGVNQNAGYAVITDSTLKEIVRVSFTSFGDGLFQAGQSLDVHDFIPVADSDYITLSYYVKYVRNIPARLHPSPTVSVVAPVIEEVNHGVVTWTWDGSMDTSFYANSVEGNNFSDSATGQDYMHMNSMFIDPRDGNLICSMRNQDQVIKISRQTGAVIWRLGGKNSDFVLSPGQVFLRQHHATLVDNNQTLLIFDDGEATLRPSSRIVEFKLDEGVKTVKGFTSFTIPEPFTGAMGSVQKMGNEYFIGGGTANYMLEVNYVTGAKIMEFKGTEPTYRAFKY